jgi:hypothetical protein
MTIQYETLGLSEPIKFLGATVVSFNGSLGLGGQESTLTVELVEDCEAGDNFGLGLENQVNFIGSPLTFPSNLGVMAFSFNGILSSWTRNAGSSGRTYSVTLTDPRRLLENTTLIIDTYSGAALDGFPNLFNVYGYYESQSDIANGSCSTFGNSGVIDDRGMPYQKIIDAIVDNSGFVVLTPTGHALPVDLSDVLGWASLPYSYRANGPAISLLQVITDVCEATGYDFYVYLDDSYTIKIGLIDLRQNPSSFSYIQNFTGSITERSFGRELRIEKQNSIIFGEKVHYMAPASGFIPYFGENTNCEPIVAEAGGSCGFKVLIDTKPLAASMRNPDNFGAAGNKYISEFDLRCNYELWVTHVLGTPEANLSQYAKQAKIWFNANDMNGDFANAFFNGGNGINASGVKRATSDIVAGNMSKTQSKKTLEHINEDAKKIHGYLESLRQTYYGKQFLCAVNAGLCVVNTQDIATEGNTASSGQCIATAKSYSAQPTNDGGWVEVGGNVLGVGDPYLGFFRQEDGRVGAFAQFSTSSVGSGRKLNLENISADEYLVNTNGTTAYVKGEVGEKIYKRGNVPYVLIKFSDACLTTLNDTEAQFPAAFLAVAEALKNSMLISNSSPGAQSLESTEVADDLLRMLSTGACCQGSCFGPTTAENCAGGTFYPGQSCQPSPCGSSTTASPGTTGASSSDKANYICGVPIQAAVEAATAGLDVSSTNKYQLIPSAVLPSVAAIPMRSNVVTYGPYFSGNLGNNSGGCNAEQNTDLAPWVFGSASTMDTAGALLANTAQMGLTQAETGSLTVVGLPQLAYIGTVINGPNLTGITTNFSSSGITTTYNFQTFTPKFGDLAKSAVDNMKNMARNRQKQLQFLRNQAIMTHNINRKLKRVNNVAKNKLADKNVADGASLQRCIMGDIYDWYDQPSGPSQRTVVGTDTLSKSVLELRYDYEKKAFMSFDGLFGPVSKGGDGGLPQFADYDHSTDSESNRTNAAPMAPQPPFSKDGADSADITMDQYNLEINQKYLDPLSNPVSSNSHHHEGDGAGHAVDIVGRGEEPPTDTMFMNALGRTANGKYTEDYRFLGMRGPLVLHAWGYDLDGKPVPNAADNDAGSKSGAFVKENLKDKFLKDWLNKPKTWPVGPVDLRFDRDRGVWVSPPSYKIVVAKLTEDLNPFGSAKAQLVNKDLENNKEYGDPLYDADGVEIEATKENGQAFIKVVDRIGKSVTTDSLVYAYYDTYLSEYIIFSAESDNKTIKFKLIDPCDSPATPTYGDDWTEYAGYGDKYFDEDPISDSYAVRINCFGEAVSIDGRVLTDIELTDTDALAPHLIIVKGVIGKWGPSFNRINGNVQRWKTMAATGYAVLANNKQPTPSTGTGSTTSPPVEETLCPPKVPCQVTYTNENDETITVDKTYEILYLESYARIIYGTLSQDLYCSETKASDVYSDDDWKTEHLNGNAKIVISKFFGNSPNGKEPIYLNQDGEVVETRVFDPFYDEQDPDLLKESPFYGLAEGSRVIAVFDEKSKKYEIIQSDKKFSSVVRFKVIDICSGNCSFKNAPNPDNDDWLTFAGFLDKWPNSHILGVRIDCDGLPIDRFGEPVTEADITDPDRAEDIFINLYDTAGQHGPAFAGYKNYNDWKSNAFTGFAAITQNPISSSCTNLGSNTDQCSSPEPQYDSYDILFLESYARFVECFLTQDLYPSEEKLTDYSDDSYKTDNPDGNSSANIISFYGGSPNAREPKFYDNCGENIDFRVFDPYKDVDKDLNPFSKLKSGDKILAIFNEKLKKYIIYSSIDKANTSKVVKFALVTNKKSSDRTASAVLVNEEGKPIDKNGNLLTQNNFNNNFITVQDPFVVRPNNIVGTAMSYSSGPAIGSSVFNEHINGIPNLNINGSTSGGGGSLFGPFIGFALMRVVDPASGSGGGGSSSTSTIQTSSSSASSEEEIIYEIITLERFAQYVQGKIGVTKATNGHYYGALTGFWDGRHPITRSTSSIQGGLNLIVDYYPTQFSGAHSFIVGDFKKNQTPSSSDSFQALSNKIDGCKFVAKLVDLSSFDSGENLIYQIIETETIALAGASEIKNTDLAEQLNSFEVFDDTDQQKIKSAYTQGFQWNKTDSEDHYKAIKILNRPDWRGKGKILKGCILATRLDSIDNNGNPIYVVEYGETIAEVAEQDATSGLWGIGGAQPDDYKVKPDGSYYQGISPANLDNNDKPLINPTAVNSWMTYQGSKTVSLWDETQGGVKGTQAYRTIFAQQAPVTIYGTAIQPFKPENGSDIKISAIGASCPGLGQNPIPQLLNKVENPLGYGAEAGDLVTLSRIFAPSGSGSGVNANYKYIVIGTGAPPGTSGGGGGGTGE